MKATVSEIERERAQTRAEFELACQGLKSLEIAVEQEARRAAEAPLQKSRMRLGDIALARQLRKQALRQI
jgi:hypothetical protein